MVFIDSFQTGGAEKSIYAISKRLTNIRPLVCTLFSDKTDLRNDFVESNIPVFELNINRASQLWFLNAKWKFEKLVEELNPDIIHANLFKSEIVARISHHKRHIPLIGSFVNDSYSRQRYMEQSFLRNRKLDFIKYIDKVTARKVSCFTSITESVASSNAEALKIDRTKVRVIYRGRDTSRYELMQPNITNKFHFLIVARLLRRKGYLELINAIKILKENCSAFICNIAGDGADAKLIKLYAKNEGVQSYIKFLGTRDDIPDLLQEAHCFIFPSHYEGQGGALVEAMLAGKPIVLSDIPVFREQIEEGNTGEFFPLRNSEELAKKMHWMMENYEEAKQLGLNARKVAEERFDIRKIAAEYDRFYAEMIEKFRR